MIEESHYKIKRDRERQRKRGVGKAYRYHFLPFLFVNRDNFINIKEYHSNYNDSFGVPIHERTFKSIILIELDIIKFLSWLTISITCFLIWLGILIKPLIELFISCELLPFKILSILRLSAVLNVSPIAITSATRTGTSHNFLLYKQ